MKFKFEHAHLKSDSLSQKGILIIDESNELEPIFVPENKQVPFHHETWSVGDNFTPLHETIKSKNLICLDDEFGWSYDYWSATLIDIDSKIIIKISQKDGYHGDNLYAEVENNTQEYLYQIIHEAAEQDIVASKIIYDICTENKLDKVLELLESVKKFSAEKYYLKIAKFYLDILPEDLRNKALAECLV